MAANAAEDPKLSEVRRVEWDVDMEVPAGTQRKTSSEVVLAREVELLVAGLVKLHHDPGVNPYNGKKAAKLVQVRVQTPALGDGYWWTSPTLEDDDGSTRARCVTWSTKVAWDKGEHAE